MSQKIIGLTSVVVMSFSANFGIRWLSFAGGMGPSSIPFWFLGAFMFFIPLALIVSEFSSLYPEEEGGMYLWTRRHLGNAPAFVLAWVYWVVNVFYYPAILTFLTTSLAYAFGRADLANNETFVTLTVVGFFWLITGLVLTGLKPSKWVTVFGGFFGTFLIVVLLIILSFVALVLFHHSATSFDLSAFKPGSGVLNNLSSLSILMFAMAGIEALPTIASAVKNPAKTLPRGIMIAAFLIFGGYALGTVAMNLIATPSEIQNTTGLMNIFGLLSLRLHLPGLDQIIAVLLVFSEVAGLIVWVIVPVVMFFRATEKGILPNWFHQETQPLPAEAGRLKLQAEASDYSKEIFVRFPDSFPSEWLLI